MFCTRLFLRNCCNEPSKISRRWRQISQYKELKKLKDQGRELYEKIEATKKAIRNNQHTEINSFDLFLMEQKFKRIVEKLMQYDI